LVEKSLTEPIHHQYDELRGVAADLDDAPGPRMEFSMPSAIEMMAFTARRNRRSGPASMAYRRRRERRAPGIRRATCLKNCRLPSDRQFSFLA